MTTLTPSSRIPPSDDEPQRPALKIRRLKLRHLLFLLLLVSGIAPLLISSVKLINTNREILKRQEMLLLTHSARAFADSLSTDLARRNEELRQLGLGLISVPGFEGVTGRLQEDWAQRYAQEFLQDRPEIIDLRLIDQQGVGFQMRNTTLATPILADVERILKDVIAERTTLYRFIGLEGNKPGVVIAVLLTIPNSEEQLIVQALYEAPVEFLASRADVAIDELFLINRQGQMLWSLGAKPQIEQALLSSDLVQDFRQMPVFSVIGEYTLQIRDRSIPTLARVVPVEEPEWGVISHKPAEQAYPEVEQMVYTTVLWSFALVLLSLAIALVATRLMSEPMQNLAEASHQIAAGHFDRRVEVNSLVTEIDDLATDFNRMSDYVENYIEQLRRAVQLNKELFISSIRAFAAAIDAKDPYTRGHSERVAAYSRAIARYLGLPKDVQERVWISAVLHDIGKIGVDDRILKKGDVLTPEEFTQMKLHPVIGADIVEPISELREMLPGIRWHHEAWNGSGYPDALVGEQIPLMARIIGVADTFDAITTSRPYQKASPPEYAIQIIKKLTGTKFDPKITSAFLLAWDSGQIAMERSQADHATAELQPVQSSSTDELLPKIPARA